MSDEPLTFEQRGLVMGARFTVLDEVNAMEPRCRHLASRDELISFANVGLIHAARTFEQGRSTRVTFETFARWRIRHALLDGMRERARHKRQILAAERAAAAFLPAWSATFDPLSEAPSDAQSKLAGMAAQLTAAMLTGVAGELGGGRAPSSEDELVARHAHAHAIGALAEARGALGAEDQALLTLVYDRGHDLKTTAEKLGMHYKSAQRRHAGLLDHLAAQLRKRGVTAAPT